jgi:uracil-DNA glycosylase
MRALEFINALQSFRSDNVFNPYSDRCELHDVVDAPLRRSEALVDLLTAASRVTIDSLWLGRDLGYRGGRRTGLALTDDAHLGDHADRWGVNVHRATVGPVMKERTAGVIWSVVNQIKKPLFLWNVFPFHPYEAGNPLTNRSHNARERNEGEALLSDLISVLNPQRLVALGNLAAATAIRVAGHREVIAVRHPSYGGEHKFRAQMQKLYGF